ncbi:MAG: glutaredoxin family protein [Deltaproteobacteria bacterium]|nr:glutaredoxin family protein [Deltaproteobacteria bacterium]
MASPSFTIYSRPDCHLCDEMQSVVAPVAAQLGATLEMIDINDSPELEQRFGLEVPVLFVNGRKAAKYRVTARELQRHLRNTA